MASSRGHVLSHDVRGSRDLYVTDGPLELECRQQICLCPFRASVMSASWTRCSRQVPMHVDIRVLVPRVAKEPNASAGSWHRTQATSHRFSRCLPASERSGPMRHAAPAEPTRWPTTGSFLFQSQRTPQASVSNNSNRVAAQATLWLAWETCPDPESRTLCSLCEHQPAAPQHPLVCPASQADLVSCHRLAGLFA